MALGIWGLVLRLDGSLVTITNVGLARGSLGSLFTISKKRFGTLTLLVFTEANLLEDHKGYVSFLFSHEMLNLMKHISNTSQSHIKPKPRVNQPLILSLLLELPDFFLFPLNRTLRYTWRKQFIVFRVCKHVYFKLHKDV